MTVTTVEHYYAEQRSYNSWKEDCKQYEIGSQATNFPTRGKP